MQGIEGVHTGRLLISTSACDFAHAGTLAGASGQGVDKLLSKIRNRAQGRGKSHADRKGNNFLAAAVSNILGSVYSLSYKLGAQDEGSVKLPHTVAG